LIILKGSNVYFITFLFYLLEKKAVNKNKMSHFAGNVVKLTKFFHMKRNGRRSSPLPDTTHRGRGINCYNHLSLSNFIFSQNER
jgi:hypothetical protein